MQRVPGRPVRPRPTAHRDLGSLVRSRVDAVHRISLRKQLEEGFNSLSPYEDMIESYLELRYKYFDDLLLKGLKANQGYEDEFRAITSTIQKQINDVVSWTTQRLLQVEKTSQECMTEWKKLSKCIQAQRLAVVPKNAERVLQAEKTTQQYIAEVIRLSSSILGLDRLQAAVTEAENTIQLIDDEFCRTVFGRTPDWTRKLEMSEQNIHQLQKSLRAAQTTILSCLVDISDLSVFQFEETLNNEYWAPREAARRQIDKVLSHTVQINKNYEELQLKMANWPLYSIRNICWDLSLNPNLRPNDQLFFGRYKDIIRQEYPKLQWHAHKYRAYWLERQMASHPLRLSETWSMRTLIDGIGQRSIPGDQARIIFSYVLGSPKSGLGHSFPTRARLISSDLHKRYKALWRPRPARSPELNIYWRQLDVLGPLQLTDLYLWRLQNEVWYLRDTLTSDHGELWARISEDATYDILRKLQKWLEEFKIYRSEFRKELSHYRHLNWMRLLSETRLHSMGEPAYLAGKFKVPNPMSQNLSRFKQWADSMGKICSEGYLIRTARGLTPKEWELLNWKIARRNGISAPLEELGSSVVKLKRKRGRRRKAESSKGAIMNRPWRGPLKFSKGRLWSHAGSPLTLRDKERKTVDNGDSEADDGTTQHAVNPPASQSKQEYETPVQIASKESTSQKLVASQTVVNSAANNDSQEGSKLEHELSAKSYAESESFPQQGQSRFNQILVDFPAIKGPKDYQLALIKATKRAKTLMKLAVMLDAVDIAADSANIVLKLEARLDAFNLANSNGSQEEGHLERKPSTRHRPGNRSSATELCPGTSSFPVKASASDTIQGVGKVVQKPSTKLLGKYKGSITVGKAEFKLSAGNMPAPLDGQKKSEDMHKLPTNIWGARTSSFETEATSSKPYIGDSYSTSQHDIPEPLEVARKVQNVLLRSSQSKSSPLPSSPAKNQISPKAGSVIVSQKKESAENTSNAHHIEGLGCTIARKSNIRIPSTRIYNRFRAGRVLSRGSSLGVRRTTGRKYSTDASFHPTKPRQSNGNSAASLSVQPLEHAASSATENSDASSYIEERFSAEERIPPPDIGSSASNLTAPQFWSHNSQQSPDGQKLIVHYCRTLQSTEETVQLFLGSKVVGFDMEWKAQASAWDSIQSNVSLIQIANEERIALFQIALFKPAHSLADLVSPSLKRLIESPDVIKVGVSIKADCTRLRKYLGIDARAIFELSHLYKLVKYGRDNPKLVNKRGVNLSEQMKEHFGLPLEKNDDVRCSDWTRALNYRQVQCEYLELYPVFLFPR